MLGPFQRSLFQNNVFQVGFDPTDGGSEYVPQLPSRKPKKPDERLKNTIIGVIDPESLAQEIRAQIGMEIIAEPDIAANALKMRQMEEDAIVMLIIMSEM